MSYRFPSDDEPDSPWTYYDRAILFPELELQANLALEHEVRFSFVMRFEAGDKGWSRGQRTVLGMAMMPAVTGQLRDLFAQLLEDALGYWPDFLIMINAEWWEQAGDLEREALIVHEMLHCGQAVDKYGAPRFTRMDNRPILQMIGHDLEEFEAVVRRYGAWKGDIASFADALREGPSN